MSNLRGELFENFKNECVFALAHADNMGLSMSLIYDGDDEEIIKEMKIARIESSEKLKLVQRASNFSTEELEKVIQVLRKTVQDQWSEAKEQYDIAVLQWENNKNNKNKWQKTKEKIKWTKASKERKKLLSIHSCNNRFIHLLESKQSDLLESKQSDLNKCQVM